MSLPFTLKKYCACLFLFLIAFASCRKKSSPVKPASTSTTTISYTGGRYTGETVYFTTTAPIGGTYAWSFGDSATGTTEAPAHNYATAGSYTVTLVYNSIDTATTTIHIGADSTAIAMIAGARLFRHSYNWYIEGIADSTYSRPDTTIPINFIDPITISFGSDTLTYFSPPFSLPPGELYFLHVFYVSVGGNLYPTGIYSYVYFFSAADSMSYGYYDHISAGSNSTDYYNTP